MTEEHPRRRRALGWGEVPIQRERPPATVDYTPPSQPAKARVWVDFPTDLTSRHFIERDERLIKMAEERAAVIRKRNKERRT